MKILRQGLIELGYAAPTLHMKGWSNSTTTFDKSRKSVAVMFFRRIRLNCDILAPWREKRNENEMQILRKRELWERLLPQPHR